MASTVGIFVFDEVEVIDYCGPFEVFSVAGSLYPKLLNKVILIAETPVIATRGGMKVQADYVIGDAIPKLDVLLIPGGYGTRPLSNNQKVLDWLKGIRPSVKYVLSVCTGAEILGKCGFVDGLVITTHHIAYEEVGNLCPNSYMCSCRRFVDQCPVYTSAGVSAGIDLALYFVKKHFGVETVKQTVKFMEYNWTDPDVGTCTCGAESKARAEKS